MSRELVFSLRRKDFKIEYMKCSKGAGGQHRDKKDVACRITHPPSGATGFSQDHRERDRNKRLAFRRMAERPEFKAWLQAKVRDLPPIDMIVDGMMAEDNIKTEIRVDGKWVPVLQWEA